MNNEHFDIDTLKHIRNKLDFINSVAKSNYNDNPELMETIENLALVAKMFANINIETLNNRSKTTSPQGYIVARLANSYSRMKAYEKRKEDEFPGWKL